METIEDFGIIVGVVLAFCGIMIFLHEILNPWYNNMENKKGEQTANLIVGGTAICIIAGVVSLMITLLDLWIDPP